MCPCLLQGNDGLGDDVDAEAQVVLNELIMLTETEDNTDGRHQSDATEWGKISHISISTFENLVLRIYAVSSKPAVFLQFSPFKTYTM